MIGKERITGKKWCKDTTVDEGEETGIGCRGKVRGGEVRSGYLHLYEVFM